MALHPESISVTSIDDIPIDELIEWLQKQKADGNTKITIDYGYGESIYEASIETYGKVIAFRTGEDVVICDECGGGNRHLNLCSKNNQL